VPAGFVVEIAVGPTGFRVADRLAAPATVGKVIAWARGVSRQPVVVLARGTAPTGAAADLLFGGLADSIDCAVLIADGPVTVTGHGILATAGVFRQWNPRGGGRLQPVVALRHRVVGDTLPPHAIARSDPSSDLTIRPVAPRAMLGPTPATGTAPAPAPLAPPPQPNPAALPPRPAHAASEFVSRPATTTPPDTVALTKADLALLDAGRWTGRWTAPPAASRVRPTAAAPVALVATPVVPGDVPAPPRTVDAPATTTPARATVPDDIATRLNIEPAATNAVWIADTGWSADDRTQLRRSLNGRYDLYARIVTRTLAEEPGLRAAGAASDVMADLVALSAYHARARDTVNKMLRTGKGQLPADSPDLLVARGAAHGLRRLPVVLGPVFAAGQDAPPVIDRYRAGDELIEPAFVDVDLAMGPAHDATVEFVIWSVSARRLDRISRDHVGTAVFPPGTRFAVLAVDPPEDGGPVRVLLRDRTGARFGDDSGDDSSAEQLLDRLRRAVPGQLSGRPQRRLTFAPGLDEHGRRFIAPEPQTSGQPQRTGRRGARS
jgi:hypothetical protein